MKVLEVRNVAEALPLGINLLLECGRWEDSRGGRVLVSPVPVATVYDRPQERVIFSALRDANPFFHLMEAMWMLGGRNDARFLDQFVHDFSNRFAEPDGHQHGAYGFRWRAHFDLDGGDTTPLDQLNSIVAELRRNPASRRAVLAMWDPMSDLDRDDVKDIPCNTHAYFRVIEDTLNLTVCCRSNDIIWGAYGANAVHFSFLLEYMAQRLGLRIGTYTQISNNFHAYEKILERFVKSNGAGERRELWDNRYDKLLPQKLVAEPRTFDAELSALLERGSLPAPVENPFLNSVGAAWDAHRAMKRGDYATALHYVSTIRAADWRTACLEWIQRHQLRKVAR